MDNKDFQAKAVAQTGRTIRFIISDESIDREGDSLVASGCDFTEFQKNPQFLGFHDYRDFPMGIPKSWGIDLRARNVWMNVYFPTIEELATNPDLASEKAKQVDTVYNMYKLGMLNAVSVGFRITDYEPIENSYGKKITKWELLEVSAVPIPCNPNAIVEARSIKSFDQSLVNQMERAMIEQKSGAKFSKETTAAHDELVKAMDATHGDFMAKCSDYKKAMKGHVDAFKAFMGASPDEDSTAPGSPGGEQEGGNAEGSESDTMPKSLDLEKVSEYLRNSGKK